MNRRGFLGGMSAAAAAAVLFYVQPTEDQIATLQKDVEDLDERVSALETQVALATPASTNSDDPSQAGAVSGDEPVVEGEGTTVSDKFALEAGQYRVHATVQDSGSGYASLILYIYDPDGNEENVFNEFGEHSGGPWEASSVYQAPGNGDYFVAVENTDAHWSIRFEAF
jgi:hypothetical protein